MNLYGSFHQKIYELLSDYRTIFLLKDFLDGNLRTAEHLNLKKIFSKEEIDRLKMCSNWINYTIYDVVHYFYLSIGKKVPQNITNKRMSYYPQAMAEQVKILTWKDWIFHLDLSMTSIMDIGCGLCPFTELFNIYNPQQLSMIHVDKRKYNVCDYPILSYNVNASNISKLINKNPVDVVFFGNSLHCFENQLEILRKIVEDTEVKQIVIIDYSSKSSQGVSLDYHLFHHTSVGYVIYPEVILKVFKFDPNIFSIEYDNTVSSQHYGIKIRIKR